VYVTKSDDYQRNAEECQRKAEAAPTDREKRTWMRLAESWLRMIVVRKVIETPEQRFDAELQNKDTGQERSDKSN
jgi:hypothetical protein